jgi:acyl dehydratase
LSLSLMSAMVRNALSIGGQKLAINYGLNRVRFISPAPAGGRIRAHLIPISVDQVESGISQVAWNIVVEREGTEKPCLVADWLVRYYHD